MRARHIVSRHLLRRTARAKADEIKRLQAKAKAKDAVASVLLREHRVSMTDHVEVERAGRIRARWVVTASPLGA